MNRLRDFLIDNPAECLAALTIILMAAVLIANNL